MSLLNNPEKLTSSQNASLAVKSKIVNETPSFSQKLRQIKSIITSLLPQDKQNEVLPHLNELQEIYLADTQKDRLKYDRIAEQGEEGGRGKRSEKVILEVREGQRITNQVKIEGQVRAKSPDRKIEEKKFMKFEPKKVKGEVTPGLGNILKNG